MGVAFFAYKYIKEYLFSPFTVAIGLVLGALLMMYAAVSYTHLDVYKRQLEEILERSFVIISEAMQKKG